MLPFNEDLELLDTIPGVGRRTAEQILAGLIGSACRTGLSMAGSRRAGRLPPGHRAGQPYHQVPEACQLAKDRGGYRKAGHEAKLIRAGQKAQVTARTGPVKPGPAKGV